MDNLTDEEMKWFKSLERCLKKMPSSVEILVQEQFNSSTDVGSTIHLIFLSLTITGIRISSLKLCCSKITRVSMMFIPSVAWIYMIWQAYTPSNFYVGLFFIVVIFEIALWISSRAEQRYMADSAS